MRVHHRVRLGTLATFLAAVLASQSAPLAAAVSAPVVSPRPATSASEDPVVRALETQLDAGASLPAAYAVLDGDQTYFGGRQGAGPDTPFVIGSVSKSFTALATMVAVSRGQLDLDSPVVRYLPEFRLADGARTPRVLVRHLLNHTSGLDLTDCDPHATDLAGRVRQLRSITPTAEPGQRFAYCNVGYAVLARLLEQVEGRPFPEVLRADVLQPLGLTRTFTDGATARAAGMAEGHTTILGFPVTRPETGFESALADGYVISTARDLATYTRFQLGDGATADGARLLPTELMTTMHRGTIEVPDHAGTELESYAMGWFSGTRSGRRVVTHSGTTDRYHADIVMIPAEQRAVVDLVAGQWLSNAAATGSGATAVLVGESPHVAQGYRIATAVLWAGLVILVITIVGSRRQARTRRRTGRRPALWTLMFWPVAAVTLAAVFALPAIQQTGSLLNSVRFGWQAAPDALVLELAWPLTLFCIGVRALRDRRARTIPHRSTAAIRVPSSAPEITR